MIIKKAADRQDGSASGLVDYIGRAMDYIQRVNLDVDNRPTTWANNCLSDDIELSKLEIESTQKMNHRARGDKTYHMIISFSPEDEISEDLHKEIVDNVCKDLGFEEHQRVCAIHKDTNNEHCHVVINKIHPKTFKVHTPYYDGYAMNDIAAELEQKYQLIVINHSNEKKTDKHQDSMHQDGVKSFKLWVIENTKNEVEKIIKKGGSWQDVSNELAKHNLHVRKSGAGLAISDKDKPLYMKASSLTRSFKKLGSCDDSITSPDFVDTKKYERLPVTGENELWTKYQEQKESNKAAKEKVYDSFKERRSEVYATAKEHRDKAKANKSLKGPIKKALYKTIRAATSTRIAELNKERKGELSNLKTGNWMEFLQKEYNENGNIEALQQLKKSKIFKPKFKNKMSGTVREEGYFNKVDKTGNSYEKVGTDKIFLVDDNLETQGQSLEVVTRLLEIAAEKYSQPLVVDGSEQFIKAIQLAAHIKGMEVKTPDQEKQKDQVEQERDISL